MKKEAAYAVAAIMVFAALAYHVYSRGKQQRFEERLAQYIRQQAVAGEASRLDLKAATDFPWDRVFIFGPYTSNKQIEQTLGTPLSGHPEIEFGDGVNLIVFMKGGNIVQSAELGRNIDFILGKTNGWTPDEAIFPMSSDGKTITVRLDSP
jgi:hypothetical protein